MSREIGNRYEDLASEWVLAQGWEIIERNWCCGQGELDIVAQAMSSSPMALLGEVIVIEVKGRHHSSGWTDSLISNRKKRALRVSCIEWLNKVENGEEELPHPMSGIQLILLRIVGGQIEIIWNAMDIDMG